MHLGDRGRRQRRFVEARKKFRHRLAQCRFDAGPGLVGGKWRHAVLQPCQFVGDVGREQVAARRERLAELDEDRAELLEGEAQPFAARAAPLALATGAGLEQCQEAQRPIEVRTAYVLVEAVPEQDALDDQQAADHAHAEHR